MLLLSTLLLGLVSQALAQAGVCNDENGLLSCIPQATVCPGSIPASVSSCACTNIQTVIRCYSSHCPAQLTEPVLIQLSSESNVVCNGIGTIAFPSGILSTSGGAAPTIPPSTAAVTTSGTGKATGVTSSKAILATSVGTASSSGGVASSTSKAAAERVGGNTVPMVGGVLGALLGFVGMFL